MNEMSFAIESIINLTRYPIHLPQSVETQRFLLDAHEQWLADGIFALKGFVFADAIERIVGELRPQIDASALCQCNVQHNIYQFDDADPFYGAQHPRNIKMHSKFYNLPSDQIASASLLRRIYEWPSMTRFVSSLVFGAVARRLHHFADPLASLTCNVLLDGDTVDWHFDEAPFTVILLLQNAEVGGEYEVAPETLLSNGTFDYALHSAVIREESAATNSYRFSAGDLIIHRGTHSIHRVTTVFGATPRITALFEYAPRPKMTLSPTVRQSTYCRTQPLKHCAARTEALHFTVSNS